MWLHRSERPKAFLPFSESQVCQTPLCPLTHQTSPDVLDGFLDVHPRPVVQHVADAGRTVDEADVVLASLRHGVKTEDRERRRKERRINSLKLALHAAALFTTLKMVSVIIKHAGEPVQRVAA